MANQCPIPKPQASSAGKLLKGAAAPEAETPDLLPGHCVIGHWLFRASRSASL
jgi:hypothetical protein